MYSKDLNHEEKIEYIAGGHEAYNIHNLKQLISPTGVSVDKLDNI